MFDPGIGRWTSEDPIGFDAGDPNLMRYLGNNPTNATDPSGLDHFPCEDHGKWIEGTRGNGVFEYGDTDFTRERGLVGAKVQYANNHIAIRGFPKEWYYRGDPALASVEIDTVKGDSSDFRAADNEMRAKLKDPNWQRPEGHTWNHAGDSTSTTMELVNTNKHKRVPHQGSAAIPRALTKAGKMPKPSTGLIGSVAFGLMLGSSEKAFGSFEENTGLPAAPYEVMDPVWWLFFMAETSHGPSHETTTFEYLQKEHEKYFGTAAMKKSTTHWDPEAWALENVLKNGGKYSKIDPVTGKVLFNLEVATKEQVEEAIKKKQDSKEQFKESPEPPFAKPPAKLVPPQPKPREPTHGTH